MKRMAWCIILCVALVSCGNRRVVIETAKMEEPVFDSSLVKPLSDSVASLYRKE